VDGSIDRNSLVIVSLVPEEAVGDDLGHDKTKKTHFERKSFRRTLYFLPGMSDPMGDPSASSRVKCVDDDRDGSGGGIDLLGCVRYAL
jgi:hypothetical protein